MLLTRINPSVSQRSSVSVSSPPSRRHTRHRVCGAFARPLRSRNILCSHNGATTPPVATARQDRGSERHGPH